MLQIIISGFITSITILMVGKIFVIPLKLQNREINFIDLTIIGLFFFGIISIIINFFLPLNKILNSFTYTIILLTYFYFFKLKNFREILIFGSFVGIISGLMLIKTDAYNPDAYLYHLPFIKILNEHKFILGIANLHSRFGLVSIFQNISALNVNYFNNLYGILTIQICLLSSVCLVFFQNIKKNLENKNFDISFYFYLFAILFCLIRFYRFNDFGNDTLIHLTIIILIFYLFSFKKDERKLIILIPLICVFLFAQKVFYIIIFGIPLIVLFFTKFKKKLIIQNIYLFFILILLFFKNFLATGCLVYPVLFTCFESVSWFDYNSVQNIKNLALSGEAWSKSWNTQSEVNMSEYIQNFNWFENWKQNHFQITIIKKLSIIGSLIFFSFILSVIKEHKLGYIKKNFSILVNNKFLYIISFYMIFCLIIWFLKFPIFRYGVGFIFYTLFLVFYILISPKIINKFFVYSLITISIIFFSSKNLQRIYSDNLPTMEKIFIKGINNKKFESKKILTENGTDNLVIYFSEGECGFYKSPCTNYFDDKISLEKLGKYKIIKY